MSCIGIICYTMEKMCRCAPVPPLVLFLEESEDESAVPRQAACTILQLSLAALSTEEMGSCLQLTKSKSEMSCIKHSARISEVLTSVLVHVWAASIRQHPCAGILCDVQQSLVWIFFFFLQPMCEDLQTFAGFRYWHYNMICVLYFFWGGWCLQGFANTCFYSSQLRWGSLWLMFQHNQRDRELYILQVYLH